MEIESSILTLNPFSRPGKKLSAVKALVVHWVGNAGTSAKQNRDYFESLKKQSLSAASSRFVSSHFIVGLEGEILQCLPTDEMAYHVGAKNYTPRALSKLGHFPNTCTIGIEMCHADASGCFNRQTWVAAAELCARLCKQLNLAPQTDILRHYDVTEKLCPLYFVVAPEEFGYFKESVEIALKDLLEEGQHD